MRITFRTDWHLTYSAHSNRKHERMWKAVWINAVSNRNADCGHMGTNGPFNLSLRQTRAPQKYLCGSSPMCREDGFKQHGSIAELNNFGESCRGLMSMTRLFRNGRESGFDYSKMSRRDEPVKLNEEVDVPSSLLKFGDRRKSDLYIASCPRTTSQNPATRACVEQRFVVSKNGQCSHLYSVRSGPGQRRNDVLLCQEISGSSLLENCICTQNACW